jgi:hypothetical protein
LVIDQISAIDQIGTVNPFYHSEMELIDDLFNNSNQLDRESIKDFFNAIAKIAWHELFDEVVPRQFLLHRISPLIHSNINRERFIWWEIWKIVSGFLMHVCERGNAQLVEMVVDILKQIAGTFLQQPELREFHFQENFMALVPDIFEMKQTNATLRQNILFSIGGLLEYRAVHLQSGWNVIFRLLTLSSVDPQTAAVGFNILDQLMQHKIELLVPLIPTSEFLPTINSFVTYSNDAIQMVAIGFYRIIAGRIRTDETESWRLLLANLSNIYTHPNTIIRRHFHDSTIEILKFILSQDVAEDVISYFIKKDLRFYFRGPSQVSDFLTAFFKEVVIPFSDRLSHRYFESLLEALLKCILSTDPELCGTAILMLDTFVNWLHSELQGDELDTILNALRSAVSEVCAMSLPNAKRFGSMLTSFVELSQDIGFVKLLYQIEEVCGSAKYMVLWSFVRLNLLRSLASVTNVNDEISECLNRTLNLFTEAGFAKQTAEEPGRSWNRDLCTTLQVMAAFNDELFHLCFDRSRVLFIGLVIARSVDVRKQLKVVMKRQLLK